MGVWDTCAILCFRKAFALIEWSPPCLRVLFRVSHYGELAPECLTAYYNYGLVLLYKAQEEADPLVSVPEKRSISTRNSEADKTVKSGEESEASMTSISTDAKQECGSNASDGQLEQDSIEIEADLLAMREISLLCSYWAGSLRVGDTEKEEGSEEGEGDGEDVSDEEEDESDLDLAWAMLDVARAIAEKQPHDSMEKVDILTALGEVSLEREDIQTSLSDYRKALSILECLVEPDSRRIVELICLVLEVGEKAEDAVPYCQKAVSVCKARLQRLMDEVKNSASTTATIVDTSSTSDSNQKEKQPEVAIPDSSASESEREIESLGGLLSDLEQKTYFTLIEMKDIFPAIQLEDLQQTIVNTRKAFSVLKMIGANSIDIEKGASSSTEGAAKPSEKVNSSQMAVISGGFDSPAVSTAATNGNVTHLGVVGRGVKRATLNPIGGEPPAKKPSLASSEEKEGSISQGPKLKWELANDLIPVRGWVVVNSMMIFCFEISK
ncbi:hypothetical protein ACLOJK_041167 [Asimina triloba]